MADVLAIYQTVVMPYQACCYGVSAMRQVMYI